MWLWQRNDESIMEVQKAESLQYHKGVNIWCIWHGVYCSVVCCMLVSTLCVGGVLDVKLHWQAVLVSFKSFLVIETNAVVSLDPVIGCTYFLIVYLPRLSNKHKATFKGKSRVMNILFLTALSTSETPALRLPPSLDPSPRRRKTMPYPSTCYSFISQKLLLNTPDGTHLQIVSVFETCIWILIWHHKY